MVFLSQVRILLTTRSLHVNRLLLRTNNVTPPLELNVVKKLKDVVGSQASQQISRDGSLIKLGIWVVIFSSMLMHVIDKKQRYEEMEEKYNLKIDILKSIINRMNNGEIVDIDDELRLVNQALERRSVKRYPSPLQNYKKKESPFIDGTVTENSNSLIDKDVSRESLEDIWQDILADTSISPPEIHYSINPTITCITSNDTHDNDIISSDDIIRDTNILFQASKQEEEELKYFTPTSTHIIVQKPGELVEAAKDTQMAKYL